jgi:hypothetical protein
LLGGLIYYFTFCRYSCSIKVDKGKIDIRYVFKKITIEFERVLVVDYNDSYYSLGSFKKHTSSVHDFPLYPYDSLKLIVVDEFGKKDSIELKINTLLLRFNKFKYFLESNCK